MDFSYKDVHRKRERVFVNNCPLFHLVIVHLVHVIARVYTASLTFNIDFMHDVIDRVQQLRILLPGCRRSKKLKLL